jgi:hypothetical protein
LSPIFAPRKSALKDCGDDAGGAVRRAWLLAFGRPASAAERTHALEFLQRRRAARNEAGEAAGAAALAELCLALFNANEFTYVD